MNAEKRESWSGSLMQCQAPTEGFIPGEDPEDAPRKSGMGWQRGTSISENLIVASSAGQGW